jgi:hypothetical protein
MQGNNMKLTLNGFDEDQFRWCFWSSDSENDADSMDSGGYGGGGSSSSSSGSGGFGGGGDNDNGSDDADSMDSGGYDVSSIDASTAGVPSGDRGGDGGSVDRVAYASPTTGQVNTRNFNTSDKYTAGMDRVTVDGKTVAVSPSAVQAAMTGRDTSPVAKAIQAAYSAPVSTAGAPSIGGTTVGIAPAAVQPFAPNFINQPLGVGVQMYSMPYDTFQRNVQQVSGYGGLNLSPSTVGMTSFQGGLAATTYDPFGGQQISQFDQGRAPTAYGTVDDRNFLEKTLDALGGTFDYQNQTAAVYDPVTGGYKTFDGQTTMTKTSDNMLTDFAVNALNPFKALTGFVDTKDYVPSAGGQTYQYSDFKGGLLSDMLGENLVSYDELEARNAQVGGEGGGEGRFIVPQEVAEIDPETGEPTQFPEFTPREYKYQPFTSKFYSIPSRFTRPMNLLS